MNLLAGTYSCWQDSSSELKQQGAGHSLAGSSHTSWLTRKPAGATAFGGEILKGRPRVLRAEGIPSTKNSAVRKELALSEPVRERIATGKEP